MKFAPNRGVTMGRGLIIICLDINNNPLTIVGDERWPGGNTEANRVTNYSAGVRIPKVQNGPFCIFQHRALPYSTFPEQSLVHRSPKGWSVKAFQRSGENRGSLDFI